MESIEIAASSVDKALEQAAEQFGVDKGQVSVTVLEETKGLFGKGQVRVRAELKEAVAVAEKKPRGKKAAEPKVEPEKEPVAKEEPAPKPAKAARAPKKTSATAVVETDSATETASTATSEIVATEADAEKIVSILSGLLDSSGLQISVEVNDVSGKYVNVSLGGRDVSYLVGRRGEVLNALQYLMNVILTRQMENGVRVVVDGDDFRQRRQEVLEKLAFDIAKEVQKRGEEAVLDALPAFERRVIHQALSEFEGVVTYSEGDEPDRRVVIAPAEAS